ncbi:MAG: hypothetical protein A2694_03340 [Candidatus Blackburnbacteria bacterium RIFCSPHIGHO2_01_FULL_40_17]|nr:MAG: hypothetical protein A2694_03340 [Candidatus Blackburnbacteria bacterium RIFCSPHIGHO2_01_FULL_40_17]OGY15271.1 MAG: hypothetical protein A3I52_01025 [Candidatus Blackburnbacteria bacterium RIFCSPLOWO2_02_FULL_40_10]
MSKQILVITGGSKKRLDPFKEASGRLGVDLTTASFSELSYILNDGNFKLKVNGVDVASYGVVYIRLVGKRREDAILLTEYAKDKGIKVLDTTHLNQGVLPKSLEIKKLFEAGVLVPKTYFGRVLDIFEKGQEVLGKWFVIKSTSGKRSKAVWSPKTKEEAEILKADLLKREENGERFFAQSFVYASQRERYFVVGDKIVAGITRPTIWRRRFLERVNGEMPEGKREPIVPIPENDAKITLSAARVASLEIAGVDVVHDEVSGETFILEVNSAPRWEGVSHDAGINIEEEIVKYLASL